MGLRKYGSCYTSTNRKTDMHTQLTVHFVRLVTADSEVFCVCDWQYCANNSTFCVYI